MGVVENFHFGTYPYALDGLVLGTYSMHQSCGGLFINKLAWHASPDFILSPCIATVLFPDRWCWLHLSRS